MIRNKTQTSNAYIPSLLIKSFACIAATAAILYMPNKIDAIYIGENCYLYGFRSVIIQFIFVVLFNLCLFSKDLSKCLMKDREFKEIEIARWKIYILIISIVVSLVLPLFFIGSISVQEDSLSIKTSIFAKEDTVLYTELEQYELFVSGDDDVFWGAHRQNSSIHYYYDNYLGKLQNNDKLIEQIEKKSGRSLSLN